MFQGPEITLKQLFQDNYCSLQPFGIMQNLLQNFWTWVWPPPPFWTMFKKTADLVLGGTPYSNGVFMELIPEIIVEFDQD